MKKLFLGFLLIFLASCMATPQIQLKSGDMAMEIKQKAPIVSKVDISPDGRYVLSGGFDSFILWDILQGQKLKTFTHPKAFMGDTTAVAFSPDGKYFASGGKGTKLWDLATRQEIMTFDDNRAVSIAFSPDGKYFLCGAPGDIGFFSKDKPPTMKIFDVATGGEIRDFKVKDLYSWSVAYSPDGKYVLSGNSGGKMNLWNTSFEKSIRTVVGSEGFLDPRVNAVSFSLDGEYALSGGSDNSVRLWNAKNLTQIKKFVGHDSIAGISSVAFSPDGKYALSAGYDSKIIMWDLVSGSEWRVFTGHTGIMGTSAKFLPGGKYVISAGDASTKIWDVSTGEEVASMIDFEDGEWIVTTSNGYYSSSPKGDQYLKVKVGGQDYAIEQLREAFYRPDLVKLALSGGSLKEFKKLADIKEPPAVSIVNTPASTDKDEITVTLKIVDSGGGVGDIRLYLNGSAVMLDSSRGVKIVASNQNEVLKTYNLKLSNGLNSIRAIAFNGDNTMQSNDAIYQITASFKTFDKPSLNALIIGINDYKNPKLQLNYAVADAKLFAE
ncbi:MAG: hypothetical protein Q8M71_04730, partial [Thermodesulfovibrionales bacterium]|nr:hypothetical protein [Thermodesulfovibrionales bacterium]